ncbi:hypothetical protein C9J21_22315, partial [Photobacterium phosphoreum]|uniref:DUF7146 domain-containing protein n=1 Tax=Photobacterium phosphoreum TaxID=659 RepID=UPI000D4F380C
GNIINLIKNIEDISFKEATTKAEHLLSEPDKFNLTKNDKNDELINSLPTQLSKLKEHAIHYDKTALPIKGTPAATYLTNKGINTENISSVSFNPAVYSSESKTTHPAMIATYIDKNKETQAIEITYLKEDGELADLTITKRILGDKSKHLIEINKESDLYPAVIIEGTENALKLNQTIDSELSVYTIDNLNNLKSIDTNIIDNQHIIIIDNNKLSEAVIDNIKESLEDKGIQVDIVKEDNLTINKQKVDSDNHLDRNDKDIFSTDNDINKQADIDLSINDKDK